VALTRVLIKYLTLTYKIKRQFVEGFLKVAIQSCDVKPVLLSYVH